MRRGAAHLVQHVLQVEEGAAAARASHVLHHRLAQTQGLKNRVADRDLLLRCFSERDTDRVAQALAQQGGDAGGALDPAVVAVARFGDTEVQGVVETLRVHAVRHHPVGGQHHRRPRRLHRDHDVVEVEAVTDADELHRALDHAQRCVAVAEQHPFRQGAVVHADAQGLVLLLQQLHQGFEGLADAISDRRDLGLTEFGAVGVGLVEHEQAWIDAHLVDVLSHLQGDLHAVVVHVRHQRHRLIGALQPLADLAHGLGMGQGWHGDPHDLAARLVQAADAGRGPLDVEGVLIDHRLHHHRVLAAHPDIAHTHAAGLAPANRGGVAGIAGPGFQLRLGLRLGGLGIGAGQGTGHGGGLSGAGTLAKACHSGAASWARRRCTSCRSCQVSHLGDSGSREPLRSR